MKHLRPFSVCLCVKGDLVYIQLVQWVKLFSKMSGAQQIVVAC